MHDNTIDEWLYQLDESAGYVAGKFIICLKCAVSLIEHILIIDAISFYTGFQNWTVVQPKVEFTGENVILEAITIMSSFVLTVGIYSVIFQLLEVL